MFVVGSGIIIKSLGERILEIIFRQFNQLINFERNRTFFFNQFEGAVVHVIKIERKYKNSKFKKGGFLRFSHLNSVWWIFPAFNSTQTCHKKDSPLSFDTAGKKQEEKFL